MTKILITGGAGFVGSSVAFHFKKQFPQAQIVCFDNLRRRGSELNLLALKEAGIGFVHGDVRNPSDFETLGTGWDAMFECSAEPSVQAGIGGSARYVLDTNLMGTINCLEFARSSCARLIFLSTSRVYSVAPLQHLALTESSHRFELTQEQKFPGISSKGISESFPCDTSRSFYGTSKLASEYLIQEYASLYRLPAYINRCGVIAGPGQFGKVDQGVYTLWVARHFFKQPLQYTGFGGTGKQVRDLLHVQDLLTLLEKQFEDKAQEGVETFNVGGGNVASTSLLELTEMCQQVTGNQVVMGSEKATHPVDVPWYISDTTKVKMRWGWEPKRSVKEIVSDIHDWICENEKQIINTFL